MVFKRMLASMTACCIKRIMVATALCSGFIVPASASPDDPIGQILRERGMWVQPPGHIQPVPHRPVSSNLIVHAMAYVGLPYSWGGGSFEEGFDCSAFVQAAFNRSMGISLPRTTAEQAQATQRIDPRQIAPGDLVFFNTMGPRYSHVGIYIGDGRFVHSPRSGAFIRIERLHVNYWRSRLTGVHRVLTDERLTQLAPAA